MARRITVSFLKNLYVFLILFLSDPFDLLERWLGVNYKPPSWVFWVLLATAVGLAIWRTVEDTKKGIRNEEQLDSIKTTLVAIDQYEREAAIKQSKAAYSNNVKAHVRDDFVAFYPTSRVGLVLQEAFAHDNADPLINFYGKFGDVLDANGCGLKDQLQSIPQYSDAIANLTSKSVTLGLRRKKVDLIHANITRLLRGGYGLNSGIVLRGMMKTIHARNKSEEAALRTVIVGLEEIENIGRQFFTYGLDHLDKKWKPRFSPSLLAAPQLQAMLGQAPQLDKKRFAKLHTFREMIDRLGQGK